MGLLERRPRGQPGGHPGEGEHGWQVSEIGKYMRDELLTDAAFAASTLSAPSTFIRPTTMHGAFSAE